MVKKKKALEQPHVEGGECRCRSCRLRRAWSEGKFSNRQQRPMWDSWQPEDDELLSQLAGRATIAEIAEKLEKLTRIKRTHKAIRIRMTKLGVSAILIHRSMANVATMFGVGVSTVRRWIKVGVLRADRTTDKPRSHFVIRDEYIDDFVRSHPQMYDADLMIKGRLKSEAEVIKKSSPLYDVPAAARMLGVSRQEVYILIKNGSIKAIKKPGVNGKPTKWFVSRRDLMAYISDQERS